MHPDHPARFPESVETPLHYFIGLGSNAGDAPPHRLLGEGRDRLVSRSGAIGVRSSALYRSTPVDCAPGTQDFVNAVISFHCATTPIAMLDLCQQVEVELGRPRLHGYHEPRTLDLDILVAGDLELEGERLVLPHPEAHRRAFVLHPMAELDPGLVIPGCPASVATILSELPGGASTVSLLREGW